MQHAERKYVIERVREKGRGEHAGLYEDDAPFQLGEPLEGDIKLCRASRTGVDMKTLATALGGVGVD